MERVVISLVIVILILINFTIIKKLNDKNKRLKKDGEKKVELIKSEAIQVASKKDNIINNLNINSNKLEEEVKKNYITISLKEKLLEENTKTIALKNDLLKNEKIEKDELKKEHEEHIARYQKITANGGEEYIKDFLTLNYSHIDRVKILHNIIFKHKNGFRQADHLVIAEKGIMVVETKFSSGKVLLGLNNSKDCEILRGVLSMKSSPFDNVTNFTGSNKYFSINITNPLSQSCSASFLLKEYIESYFKNMEINNYSTVIILPEIKEDRNPEIIDLRNKSKCNYFNSISKDFKELKTNIDDFITPPKEKKLNQDDINKIYQLLTNSLKFTYKEIFK